MRNRTSKNSIRTVSRHILQRRRLPIVLGAAFVAVAAGALYLNAQSNKAAAIAPDYICLTVNSGSKCLDGNANPIRLSSAGQLRYFFTQLGTNGGVVSSSKSWPFSPGSGMNAHYNGHAVYLLYQANGTSCLGYDTNAFPAQVDTWTGCSASSSKKTWWVNSGGWLVNVGRTNEVGDVYPSPAEHMTANCTGLNCKVILSNGVNYANDLENWTY